MGRILFIPVSGSQGSGEVQRCRLLADAVHAHAPRTEPHFLLAAGAPPVPWPVLTLAASPTRAVPEVVAAIALLRPALVVFDGNARVEAMDAARAAGARVVLISPRPSARTRGFSLRRMSRLDEHWLVGPELVRGRGLRERVATRMRPAVRVRRFGTLFARPAPPDAVLARLGVERPFVVVCPGGGGHVVDGRCSRLLFGEASTLLAARGVATVSVAAPAAIPAIDAGALANPELMALLSQADAALLGGGSLLVQALALGVPAVALPLQREQARRVAWLAAHRAARAASGTDAAALASDLEQLCGDRAARDALRAAAAALELDNGVDEAAAALAGLALR